MNYEQQNLFNDRESFKRIGKSAEKIEEEAKADILEKKIDAFITEKNIKKERTIGGLDIQKMAEEFISTDRSATGIILIKKILAMRLREKGFFLTDAVIMAEIGEENLDWLGDRKKLSFREKTIRARLKLPPQQRGIPTGDLDLD